MTHLQDWNAYRQALYARVGDFAKLSPDVMRGLHTVDSSATKAGHLAPKIHELIARAVAVTTRCDGCIVIHTQKAVDFGASPEEIGEAMGVAIALNAGAAVTYTGRVFDALAAITAAK